MSRLRVFDEHDPDTVLLETRDHPTISAALRRSSAGVRAQ